MSLRLRVNPIKCTGHGVCAELLPELIGLDPWGFPIVSPAEVPRALADHARRAVSACPTLALVAGTGGDRHSLVAAAAADVRPRRRNPP